MLKLNPRVNSGIFMPTNLQKINGNFKGKDILSIDQFSPKDMQKVFLLARKMEKLVLRHKPSTLLAGHVVAAIFYEPSTRTFSSF
jgi:aspartate carbamoyltransferase catalytic subunit